MILVSGCLCGINCKYNGGNNFDERVYKLLQQGNALPVCPEQLGGQATPRVAHEIIGGTGGDVLDGLCIISGQDLTENVTEEFIRGANETLKLAKACNITTAILKARSPSCGFGEIYNGQFDGTRIEGNGVTAELLYRNGIKIFTEEDEF